MTNRDILDQIFVLQSKEGYLSTRYVISLDIFYESDISFGGCTSGKKTCSSSERSASETTLQRT